MGYHFHCVVSLAKREEGRCHSLLQALPRNLGELRVNYTNGPLIVLPSSTRERAVRPDCNEQVEDESSL
jgi:hypothetical protein